MGLCKKSTPRHCVGFHRGCDGTVNVIAKKPYQKKDGTRTQYHYLKCSACGAYVTMESVVPERYGFIKQQTAGHRRRRPRYDINSWKDVKI